MSWYKYVGLEGAVVGLYRFGKLAPGGEVRRYFGFAGEHVAGVAGGLATSRP
jgi:transketolase